ncbi:hypothetical protein FAIPA1_10575 [Frankia sp. AiPs1]
MKARQAARTGCETGETTATTARRWITAMIRIRVRVRVRVRVEGWAQACVTAGRSGGWSGHRRFTPTASSRPVPISRTCQALPKGRG